MALTTNQLVYGVVGIAVGGYETLVEDYVDDYGVDNAANALMQGISPFNPIILGAPLYDNAQFAAVIVDHLMGGLSLSVKTAVIQVVTNYMNVNPTLGRGAVTVDLVEALLAVPDNDLTFAPARDAFLEKVALADAYTGGSYDFDELQDVVTDAPVVYALSVDAPAVTEGDDGTKALTFTLTLDDAPTEAVTVFYQTLESGSATAGDDFVVSTGSVTFAAGQTTATASIPVVGDMDFESDETVDVRFYGDSLAADVVATGTITNDDALILTLTPEVDNIVGTAADERIDGNSETYNSGDAVDGGAGTDTLYLVLNESDTPYAGADVSNVELLEIRSQAVDGKDATVISMTDFDDSLQEVKITKSTGNTVIEDLQAGVDVIIDDVRGNVEIDFDNQNVPDAINVSVNEFGESAGADFNPTLTIDAAVETVNLSDDAVGSTYWNGFDLEGGFSQLNVTGGANGTELDMGIMSSAAALTVDLTANESDDKNISVDMGDADQTLTLMTGDYSDDVEIYADDGDNVNAALGQGDNNLDVYGEVSNVTVTAGAGEDSVYVDNWPGEIDNAYFDLGNGDNSLNVDDAYRLQVYTGSGDDTVFTDDVSYWATMNLGDGDNSLYMDNLTYLNLTTGAGDDYADIGDFYSVNIGLGEGNNTLDVDDGTYLTVTTGADNDTVYTGSVYWSNIHLGDGGNSLYMDNVDIATVVTGSGADYVSIGNGNVDSDDLNISVGGSDDWVYLGGGGLEVNTNWWAGSDYHTVAGGEGDDTLEVNYLWNANAAGSFAHVTSVETLATSVDGFWWGGVTLDGGDTGANAAGVSTYDLRYGNDYGTDIALLNMVNNVTVNMTLDESNDDEGQNFTLTQTPDDGANTANVHFTMYDSPWWHGDDYYFGNITVDTTEVLNLSGDDWWTYAPSTLHIQDLVSADLTTLNLSGDLEFNFWNIAAPNLSLVDATGMTVHAEIELNDVVNGIVTVLGGSAHDEIVLKDSSTAMVADGGAGNDTITIENGADQDDHLSGGEGNDTIYAGAGVDSVYGGDGDDTILWDAAELFAVDVVDGGADYDTVQMNGSLGTQNDSFFFQWSGVENLILDDGGNVLTLGIIASVAGLEEIHLSDDGGGNGDQIALVEGWSNDTSFYLSDGDDEIVEAAAVGVDLRVYANASQVTVADTLVGANGSDTLFLTADNGTAALDFVTGFETVMVVQNGAADIDISTTDTTVAAGATLTVDARALVDTDGVPGAPYVAGDLYFDGTAELDGSFVVWGGDGDDEIYGGAGADTITTGNGADYVEGGGGADSISTGAGNDEIYGDGGNDTINAGEGNNYVEGGDGNDSITTGAGNDEIYGDGGNDVIAAGNGTNYIVGGLGADQMSGGTGVDTYYLDSADAEYGAADVITGFNAGDATGVAPADLFQTWAAVTYLGAYANATLGLLALQANPGGIEAVLVSELDGTYLYIDVNGDDAFNNIDAAIKMVGMTGTLDQTDFFV